MLFDRRRSTTLAGAPDGQASLDFFFVRPVKLCALHLIGADEAGETLPRRFRLITIQPDGREIEIRAAVDRFRRVWTAGAKLWIMGWGAHLECRFEPTDTQHLRLDIMPVGDASRQPKGWPLAEVLFLADEGHSAPAPDDRMVENLAARLEECEVDFLVADRWLAAKIEARAAGGGRLRSWPRRNPRYPKTLLPLKFSPRRGLAIAVETAWAEDTATVLQDAVPWATWDVMDFGAYTVFWCRDPGPPGSGPSLEWQGSFLLRCDP